MNVADFARMLRCHESSPCDAKLRSKALMHFSENVTLMTEEQLGPSPAIIHSHNARRDPNQRVVLHEVKNWSAEEVLRPLIRSSCDK